MCSVVDTFTEAMDSFIFREDDFDEAFSPAAFVAKYKRVTNLESLKDDLHRYCSALKSKLYATINEEYKDFITIATKLDGADQRVELVRQPLLGLRMDLSTLHDNMTASIKAVEEKLAQRNQIAIRKRTICSYISCLDRLEDAEATITGVFTTKNRLVEPTRQQQQSSRSGRRSELLTSLFAGNDKNTLDIFQCSEVERAAFSLQSASLFLNNGEEDQPNSSSLPGGNINDKIRDSLRDRIMTCISALLDKARGRLESIFSTHASMVSSAITMDDKGLASVVSDGPSRFVKAFPTRSATHLLRALLALGRADVAEECIVNTLVMTHAKSVLTQGRVDGAGGRGSFAALKQTLLGLVSAIAPALKTPICLLDSVTLPDSSTSTAHNVSSNGGADILMRVLWKTVADLLESKFPGIFSTGIASTLHSSYEAVMRFTTEVHTLAVKWSLSTSTDTWQPQSTVEYTSFNKNWRFDLYFSLRVAEISRRVESVCMAAMQEKAQGTGSAIMDDVFTELYDQSRSKSTPSNKSSSDVSSTSKDKTPGKITTTSSSAALVLSLPLSRLEEVLTQQGFSSYVFDTSFFKCFAAELLTCLDDKIILAPLTGRFLGLVLQLLHRVNKFVGEIAEVSTASDGAVELDGGLSTPTGSPIKARTSDTPVMVSLSTPTTRTLDSNMSSSTGKGLVTPIGTTSTPSTNTASNISVLNRGVTGASSTSKPLPSRTAQELSVIALDCCSFAQWLNSQASALGQKMLQNSGVTINTTINVNNPVEIAVKKQSTKLLNAARIVWEQACHAVTESCKYPALANVRTIAGKFRMTNKPTPDRASAYVSTLLAPLSEHYNDYAKRVQDAGLFSSVASNAGENWVKYIIEDVSAEFLTQVQALLETARNMDSSLQRRTMLSTKKGSGVGTGLSDSDKITVQVWLDVKAFGEDIKRLGINGEECDAYVALLEATKSAEKMMT